MAIGFIVLASGFKGINQHDQGVYNVAAITLGTKLNLLWLSGHTPEEAFKITHAGTSRRIQDAGFGLDYCAKLFALWNVAAKKNGTAAVYLQVIHARRDVGP